MTASDRSLAYALLRIALGVNFLGHGVVRLCFVGLGNFAAMTAQHMAKAPLPHDAVVAFAYFIPVAEVLLGLALVLGLLTRVTLVAGALFMMALTVGVTANQQWDVAGQQLLYSLIFFVLLWLCEYNTLSVDARLKR